MFFLQDILENESINLDWMFRYSLINDIVKVRATPEPGWELKKNCEDETHVEEGVRALHDCLQRGHRSTPHSALLCLGDAGEAEKKKNSQLPWFRAEGW